MITNQNKKKYSQIKKIKHQFSFHFLENITTLKIFKVIFFVLLFIFLFSKNFVVPVDPDFGWHLKYAKEFYQNGKLPLIDTFSHSYYGISITDTEWLADVVSYLFYFKWSFWGFSFFYAIISVLILFIPIVFYRIKPLLGFLFCLFVTEGVYLVSAIGGRSQNFSWLFLTIFVILILNYLKNFRNYFFIVIPLFFLVWCNIHPSYYLGLILLGIFIFWQIISKIILFKNNKFLLNHDFDFKEIIPYLGLFLLTFIATQIRPHAGQFSQAVSLDLFKALFFPLDLAVDSSAKGLVRIAIAEWLPPFYLNLPGIITLVSIVFSIAIYSHQKISKTLIIKISFLLFAIYFGTVSHRNNPIFYAIALPVILSDIYFIFPQQGFVKKKGFWILNYMVITILIIFTVIFLSQDLKTFSAVASEDSYCTAMNYPCQAIKYLKENPLKGKMFNNYNWGGYLIWQLPEYPVFVDGRVPEYPIFAEYQKVINLQDGYKDILNKYDISFILNSRAPVFEQRIEEELKWKKVYSDDFAIIYAKN